MYKISVIIPAYNTEDYMEECLDSLLQQTIGDIEIIVVNDGSTDSSLEILKEYLSKVSDEEYFYNEIYRDLELEGLTQEYLLDAGIPVKYLNSLK